MLYHIWKETYFCTQLLTHWYLGITLGSLSWQSIQTVLSFDTQYQGDFSCTCHDSASYYNLAMTYFPLFLKRVKITSEIPNFLLSPSTVSNLWTNYKFFLSVLVAKLVTWSHVWQGHFWNGGKRSVVVVFDYQQDRLFHVLYLYDELMFVMEI